MSISNQEINAHLEAFFQEKNADFDLSNEVASNSRERYIVQTAHRLLDAYEKWQSGSFGESDFLGALRNYLLTLQVEINLGDIEIPIDNDFGISKDEETGKYFAVLDAPEYVCAEFVESAFRVPEPDSHKQLMGFNLSTPPSIRELTGFKSFKSVAQKIAVCGALSAPEGYTALISLPTGGGKSLITQTIAYQQDGLTVAVVPTVSLAIDQVRVAKKLLKTVDVDEEVFYYSSGVDVAPLLKAIHGKRARLLFTSPEALMENKSIKEAIEKANAARYLKNIIIDEAHIVVDWGALFRVDYQCLECWRRHLILSNSDIRTILLSATFEEGCVDVLKKLFSDDGEKWIEIRCDSLRREPRFMHIRANSYSDKIEKMLNLVRKMPRPMVVYVASPDEANKIEMILRDNDIKSVRTFTGMTPGNTRKILIDEWTNNRFEIMVATSAFGVGVDKSDVRTVLHLYVPQNPNAYYQELGRGGRDRLPCLSIMCVGKDDLSSAFGIVSKKVLTTEKVVGRWLSMYNSMTTKRKGDLVYVDTAVVPNYSDEDSFDDKPLSERHKDWNIYVLLFLRRNGLIELCDIVEQDGRYIFIVKIIDDSLCDSALEMERKIDPLRSKEREGYFESFEMMRRAIRRSGDDCWSEMFYETYHKVSEYCAGCNEHEKPHGSGLSEFPLKTRLASPTRTFDKEQLSVFGDTNNLIVIAKEKHLADLFAALAKIRVSALISTSDDDIDSLVDCFSLDSEIIPLNLNLLKELMRKNSLLLLSGIVVVRYTGTPRDVYGVLRFLDGSLGRKKCVKMIHVIDEDFYFEWLDKRFTDVVDGLVRPLNAFV